MLRVVQDIYRATFYIRMRTSYPLIVESLIVGSRIPVTPRLLVRLEFKPAQDHLVFPGITFLGATQC